MSVKLSVNINKIATLRNARGHNNPNVAKAAIDCQLFGADGVTVHPRPDERHIRYADVREIAPLITTEFNIEGYPDERFLQLTESVLPAQVTLVPDPPGVLTSNAGWNTVDNLSFLKEVVARLHEKNMRVSLFLDPLPQYVEAAKLAGADRIELYTEDYAKGFLTDKEKAIAPYVNTAKEALNCGLEINAGHDLDLNNLNYFVQNIEGLQEVSIGHALICDALYLGLQNVIQLYKARCKTEFRL